ISHDIMSIVQNGFVDVPSDLQTELDRTKEKLEHFIINKEKEYDVLWNNWNTKCEEYKYDKISYDKAYNVMQQKVERLQAQLEDLKGKSSDTPSASDTLDPLIHKLETKIVELEFQVVSEQKDTTHGTSANTKLAKQLISRKPPSSSRQKLYVVTPLPKSKAIPKVGESNALSKPITSNSTPSSCESTVMNNERVIALGIFRINPFKASRILCT
nr:hypothetical protein [Tanacetum cinerariifolium]